MLRSLALIAVMLSKSLYHCVKLWRCFDGELHPYGLSYVADVRDDGALRCS